MFENKIYTGIREGLHALGTAGWRLSVVTSKPLTFAIPILAHFALDSLFASVYGSELSGERSDKAELIAHALRAERASADQVIMIGDRAHDIHGARANGVQSLGVLWGYGTREELVQAGADGICETVDALVADLARRMLRGVAG